jgi:hypothetical protein
MTILPSMLLIYSKCAEFKNSNLIFLENKKISKKFVKRLEQIMRRLVKKVFENNIVSLVKIQIYSNSIFLASKKIREKFVKRLDQILSRLVKKGFKNDIVLLVKIQIYSNSDFLRK